MSCQSSFVRADSFDTLVTPATCLPGVSHDATKGWRTTSQQGTTGGAGPVGSPGRGPGPGDAAVGGVRGRGEAGGVSRTNRVAHDAFGSGRGQAYSRSARGPTGRRCRGRGATADGRLQRRDPNRAVPPCGRHLDIVGTGGHRLGAQPQRRVVVAVV